MELLSRSDANAMTIPRNLNGTITAVMEQMQTMSQNHVLFPVDEAVGTSH